jgi:hypothetical protein
MQYFRCKCGRCTSWSSAGSGPDCRGCEECKTTFAQHPDYHRPLQPHIWRTIVDSRTGKPSHRECEICYTRERLDKEENG